VLILARRSVPAADAWQRWTGTRCSRTTTTSRERLICGRSAPGWRAPTHSDLSSRRKTAGGLGTATMGEILTVNGRAANVGLPLRPVVQRVPFVPRQADVPAWQSRPQSVSAFWQRNLAVERPSRARSGHGRLAGCQNGLWLPALKIDVAKARKYGPILRVLGLPRRAKKSWTAWLATQSGAKRSQPVLPVIRRICRA